LAGGTRILPGTAGDGDELLPTSAGEGDERVFVLLDDYLLHTVSAAPNVNLLIIDLCVLVRTGCCDDGSVVAADYEVLELEGVFEGLALDLTLAALALAQGAGVFDDWQLSTLDDYA